VTKGYERQNLNTILASLEILGAGDDDDDDEVSSCLMSCLG
jgi:hypothetical protein